MRRIFHETPDSACCLKKRTDLSHSLWIPLPRWEGGLPGKADQDRRLFNSQVPRLKHGADNIAPELFNCLQQSILWPSKRIETKVRFTFTWPILSVELLLNSIPAN